MLNGLERLAPVLPASKKQCPTSLVSIPGSEPPTPPGMGALLFGSVSDELHCRPSKGFSGKSLITPEQS